MRLTPTQVDTIRDTARRCFGQGADVLLFGSRVDDTRRGGDIDLCIETDLDTPEASWDAERRFLGSLYMALGEQKIDVVVKRRGDQRQLPIFKVARAQGVHL